MNLSGTTLGKYEILEEIASGGMAIIYRARQPALERDVAVKILRTDLLQEPKNRERFEREAKAAAQLHHPNILTIYDAGWDPERNIAYIVMEYVPGGTLGDLIGKPMPLEQIAWLVEQISEGLHYAHSRGVIHRDIKPSNILLAEDNRVLIADFGLASIVGGGTRITVDGEVLGTPDYMAPEQIQGDQVDARADVYSLGIVVYEMVAGQLPFQAETAWKIITMRMTEEPPPLRALLPDLPPSVEAPILKAIAKEPDKRFPDILAFSQALKGAVRPKTSSPTSVPVGRKGKRKPLQIGDTLDKGRYEVVKFLGEGAWSIVYLGYDRRLKRDVSLKFLQDKIANDPKEVKRFRREPQITARIGIHPNIVSVYDFKEDDEGINYMVIEYVDEGSLREYLKKHQTLQTLDAVRFGLDICYALDAVHENKIVHLDLKPGNVMLKTRRRRLTAKVSDFGTAIVQSPTSEDNLENPTPTGYPRGTLFYTSPEQIVYKVGDDLDGRADLYSLGVVLYEMVTGRVPFGINDPKPLAERILEDPPLPPTKYDPFVSTYLEEVIMRALSKRREDRFRDANEMLDALEQVQRKEQASMSKFEALISEAKSVFERGDWAAALNKFKALLPARSRASQEEVEQYIQDCEKYIKLEADYQKAKQSLAERDWATAVELLKIVTRADSDYLDGRANKELDEAMINLSAIQEYEQGLAYFEQGDLQKAERQLRETMALFPDLVTVGEVLEELPDKLAQVRHRMRLETLLQKVQTQTETARSQMTPESWQQIVQIYREIVSLDPDAREYRSQLEKARQQADLATLYKEGAFAKEAGNWTEAATAYRQIIQIDRGYRDAAVKLTEAEDHVNCQQLREKVDEDFADYNWLAARKKLEEIRSLLPDYQDAAELLGELEVWLEALKDEAQRAWLEAVEKLKSLTLPPFVDLRGEKIAYLRQQAELAELYQTGIAHYEADEWRRAREVFQQIHAIDSGYENVPELLRELSWRARLDWVTGSIVRHPRSVIVLGIIIIAVLIGGAISLYNVIISPPPSIPELQSVEVWVDGAKTDPDQPHNIVGKRSVEIEVKGLDSAGNLLSTDKLVCHWIFLPAVPDSHPEPGNECAFSFQVPTGADSSEQSILVDVVGKDSAERKELNTSVVLILQRE